MTCENWGHVVINIQYFIYEVPCVYTATLLEFLSLLCLYFPCYSY